MLTEQKMEQFHFHGKAFSNASRYVLSVDGRADIDIDGNLNSYT